MTTGSIELYDCTIREGEQAAGASFILDNRIKLFSLLDDFGFDFIELGWPVASEQILKSFEECRKIRKKARIVAFGSTSMNPNINEDNNLNSILMANPDYACIFGKSHLDHVKKQLKLSPEENLERIKQSIIFLIKNNIPVFYDAEHYFDAFKAHREYALSTLFSALAAGAERIILCDTNGGTLPYEAREIVRETKEVLERKLNREVKLGVHFHNDCGLALANSLESLAYVSQVQGTINGIGERVGNLNFSEFISVYMAKLGRKLDVKIKNLKELNERTFMLAGLDIPESRPFVGDFAFAHKGGVHIDATNKGASYEHHLPEYFGNKRVILLNTLGGAAGVMAVAEQFGYKLNKKSPSVKKRVKALFKELRCLEEAGYRLGSIDAEQYLLIEKHFGKLKEFFHIKNTRIEAETWDRGESSRFSMTGTVGDEPVMGELSTEGGPIDAAYKTLKNVLLKKYPLLKDLRLVDFHVGIAARRGEESTVRTVIYFQDHERFHTVGVDSNVFTSSIQAIEKGFRYYLNKVYGKPIK